MEYKEFSAKNTEEALKEASEYYNLPLNQLEVEVVSSGSSGFLGMFGAKKAKVLARPSRKNAKDEMAEMMKEFSTQDSFGKARPERPKPAPKPPRPRQQPEPRRQPEPAPAPRPEMRSEPEQDLEANAQPESDNVEDQAVLESAKGVLTRLLASLDDVASVNAELAGNGINLEIEGGESGILIGRRGQTLEALQYLTTRIVSHQQGRPVKINIDAGGYRRRRRDNMTDLAVRMAQKAKKTGKPVAVGPLAAQDRRIIHLALRNENGISTTSRGRGEMKKVIINPRYHQN